MFNKSIGILATAAVLVSSVIAGVAPVLAAPAATKKTPAKAAPVAAKPAAPMTVQNLPADLAAVVDGHKITMAEVIATTLQQDGPNVVEWQIEVYLIDREAKKYHLTVPSAAIDSSVNTLAKMQTMPMDEALKKHHETMSQLREELREGLVKQAVAQHDFPMSSLSHICVIAIQVSGQPGGHTDNEAQSLMQTIQDQLKAGKSFTTLAAQYTEDPAYKNAGGDVGVIYTEPAGVTAVGSDVGLAYDETMFDPAFIKAASTLKTGDVTPSPIRTKFGYELLTAISTGANHPSSEDGQYAERNLEGMLVRGLLAEAKIVNRFAL
jgi:hypothetical protein